MHRRAGAAASMREEAACATFPEVFIAAGYAGMLTAIVPPTGAGDAIGEAARMDMAPASPRLPVPTPIPIPTTATPVLPLMRQKPRVRHVRHLPLLEGRSLCRRAEVVVDSQATWLRHVQPGRRQHLAPPGCGSERLRRLTA